MLRVFLDIICIMRYISLMTTEAQIAANRANARHSTGPNTPEGRAKSSRNARKRRRPGDLPVTLAEDAAAFAAHAEAVARAL
jgi:hypothetical protein